MHKVMGAFYSGGLIFSCRRCSACCRFDPGVVLLSEDDERALCRHLALEPDKFEQVYCRWIPQDGVEQLSLKEKSNYDCIFWKDGCTVYEARPLSCKTYPFWRSMLVSREVWEATSAYCPGVRSGERHSGARIEECLSNEDAQVMVVRNRGRL